jgi:hypothetical protein
MYSASVADLRAIALAEEERMQRRSDAKAKLEARRLFKLYDTRNMAAVP